MQKLWPMLLILVCNSLLAQDESAEYFDPAAIAEARVQAKMMSGGQSNFLIIGERLEQHYNNDENSLDWEGQGWFGTDLNKFWLKTEGSRNSDSSPATGFEVQALYSRAVDSFWDLQAGLRQDFRGGPEQSYAVLGVQGLAPYWFELDTAAFVSEAGKLSTRLEAEYELRLTQRLILQPRLELNYNFSDDRPNGIFQGFDETSIGLRIRYEIKREFAPYIGVAWQRGLSGPLVFSNAIGAAPGNLTRVVAGEKQEQFNLVAGFRFWY